ncbi:hypothetical protein Atep_29980 (plasmid) [Allochromatium tepidum]|uniref:Uncharacterized protein n=2 Tax=Allochromatium tepidum TaxID=553982 RepID=A0ABN6GED2_9GAMM|nr:hypothetical protein Atep_29980 [Allochromatium tepidum]
MLISQEIRRRLRSFLGIKPELLPEIHPCGNCNSSSNIEILYSATEGTFAITCLVDGWITGEHSELFDAIKEWNQHHALFLCDDSQSIHPKKQNARLN